MSVTLVTVGYAMMITNCYVLEGDLVTKDTFKWVSTHPPIVRAACMILRLMDDIATRRVCKALRFINMSILNNINYVN